MTEYRTLAPRFEDAGYSLAFLSSDQPQRSQALRQRLRLDFMLLCDPSRATITAWGLLNALEAGGVAKPATFVIGSDRHVLTRSLDGYASRATAANVLAAVTSPQGIAAPKRSIAIPGREQWSVALRNLLRLGG
ncbi:redoxin domain-containing protein [bacterium]|nr:MAG: redoxin domain-containing protein [bacterium]